MSHAGVNQNSFRTPSELIQKAFRVIQESLGTHSEFVQNLVRSHSGFIQISHSECIRNEFRTHSELIQNSFRKHSRINQEPFMSYAGVSQVWFRIQLGLIQNLQEKWTKWELAGRIHEATNSSRKTSLDEFIGLRIHRLRSCRTNSSREKSRLTNSSDYEFIMWDLAERIHQVRNLAWRIQWATDSSSVLSLDEVIGLRIHRGRFSQDEFILWEVDATSHTHRGDPSHPFAVARSA